MLRRIKQIRSGAVALLFLGAYGVAALAPFMSAPMALADSPQNPNLKDWVCKYTGKPGVDEQLKNGNDGLVWVSTNATQGVWFNDAQGRSYVLLKDEPHDPAPDASSCPAPEGPAEDASASFTLVPATCTLDGSVTFTTAFATLTSGGATTPGEQTATFTADAGHTFADGSTTLTLNYTVPAMLSADSEECAPPDTSHQPITFCHATPPETAAQGYQMITTDVGAFYQAGHIDHPADIYPAGSFTKGGHDFSWNAQGDQSLLQYPDCQKPTTPTPNDASASFTLVPATCTLDGSVTFTTAFATLTSGGATTPGEQTATFTADAGHTFADGSTTLTLNYTVPAMLSADSEECYIPTPPTPVTPGDPTVAIVCGPNNDVVTIPTTAGVTYTDSGWVNGTRTISAAANENFVLNGTSTWTFTDTNTSCGQVLGDSTTTPNVLAASTTVTPSQQLENTGNNIVLPIALSSGVLGLAVMTIMQNSTRKSKFAPFVRRMIEKARQALEQPFLVPMA